MGGAVIAARVEGSLLDRALAIENCLDNVRNSGQPGFGAASARSLGIVDSAKCSRLSMLRILQQAGVDAVDQAMNMVEPLISLPGGALGSDKLAR